MVKIGLALGSGGAKGFAHVPILEALDELGIKPARIAGTSVGAVIGALYAAGLSAREIRETVDDLVISEEDDWREILRNKDLGHIADLIRPGLVRGSLLHMVAMTVGEQRFHTPWTRTGHGRVGPRRAALQQGESSIFGWDLRPGGHTRLRGGCVRRVLPNCS